ncbi:MAG: HAMP domain-containing histidine kinase [Magnetococcales bacterium]|nr:HAMP domain-containing histidine kinase [Magnetococcales bacterium]
MRQSSLQFKVILGYTIISTMTLCLSLFSLVELRTVSLQLISGEHVYLLLNNVLEMRRFEKNYFLYHQQRDREQWQDYIKNVVDGLHEMRNDQFGSITNNISKYSDLVQHAVDNSTEETIRGLGKMIVTSAEEVAATERIQIHQALEKHQFVLVAAMIVVILVILALGRMVSRWIVLPLKLMEDSMIGVVNGQFTSIHIHSNDREILSLTKAFNLVLQELQQRHKHLLRSEKLAALGTLLSGVAHELNNPLSNISSSCQILYEEVESDDLEFRRELLSQVDEQTRRARDIVRSLLDFSRDREFKKSSFLLAPLIAEVIRFSKGNLPNRIQVHTEIPEQIVLHGDRQRLQQAFINLLKNSADAIPDTGNILIRALMPNTTQLPTLTAGRCRSPWVDIVVQDTGTGISEEHVSRIFDPFFTTKPVGKGSGLGLAVVFEVIEEHAGDIVVESQIGQGTRFIIRLPVQENCE